MRRTLATLGLIVLALCLGGLPEVLGQQPDEGARQPAGKRRQGGFTFQRFAGRHDADKDGKITRDEFKGHAEFFKRCDRDGDGVTDPDLVKN